MGGHEVGEGGAVLYISHWLRSRHFVFLQIGLEARGEGGAEEGEGGLDVVVVGHRQSLLG